MVHVILLVFIWYTAAWKNKNNAKFYSVQPCKIQQVLSLCFTIFYDTELKAKANYANLNNFFKTYW